VCGAQVTTGRTNREAAGSVSSVDETGSVDVDALSSPLDRFRLVVTPWTRAPCTARSSRSAAWARLPPYPMTLASIAS
jgi:hypothetical protein